MHLIQHSKTNSLTTLVLVMFISSLSAFGQSVNTNWQQTVNQSIAEFKSCEQKMENGVNPCSKYTGQAINDIYKVNDFYSKDLGRYMTGSEINQKVKSDGKWQLIGKAFEQSTLDAAQEAANANKAVIATFSDENQIGHVSIILPGNLMQSGSWGLKVPNSASFFMHKPDKSYAGKSLAYAFPRSSIMKVEIYVREY